FTHSPQLLFLCRYRKDDRRMSLMDSGRTK
ncbi:hypothetical protein NPIL_126841, partial [Nephila pilipes]